MRPEIAQAQASTLREWAAEIERDLLQDAPPGSGFGEAAFLYRRAAKVIEAASKGITVEPEAEKPNIAAPADAASDLRAG